MKLRKRKGSLRRSRQLFDENRRMMAGYMAGFSRTYEDLNRKKNELGISDMEFIPCTEDNLEKAIGYLSHIIERVVQNVNTKASIQ